ncbi:murein biosynthesis integral membrane protein MurJ, partial [bacterium]|nr:murein biosynthesis integral membrane protein MurJ [bacterium]NIO73116.1 murein biosynthesis integral membrane protein MurJ [bacterium]
GVLNSLRHFFAPAFSPLLLNVSIIAAVFILYKKFSFPTVSLALGVIVGGVIQLVFQLPVLAKKGFFYSFRKTLFHPAVKRIGLLIVPQLFGVGVYHLNILVSTQYASYLPEGTFSYLFYSERLIEFPLGVFAVSIATVLLP